MPDTKLVSLCNKLWLIRLIWVTAVTLLLLLNAGGKLESLQEDGVVIEKPERQVHKASHCGSKQQ